MISTFGKDNETAEHLNSIACHSVFLLSPPQEHRQEARHHHTSQPSQRRCSQDCPLRQIPFNVAGKPRAAVGKKYLSLGKESRDNTASETSSARPGMCARIHPGRDRDRWSGRHQIRKTRRVATVTTLLHIQLALRPEQLSTHKYVCVSATRSGKAR